VSEPSGSLTAVVVSGGKQYRVAPGDRILVDRLKAEPGSELKLERVLLISDGDTTKVGLHELMGQVVRARVMAHPRGPKIDVIRYKPKKRVRVHRGARADLTALEILTIGPAMEEAKPARASRPSRAKAPSKPAKEQVPSDPAEGEE
jgi:large subunit ribosomal protein L21